VNKLIYAVVVINKMLFMIAQFNCHKLKKFLDALFRVVCINIYIY
jgi:hypothetical protein